MLYVSYISIKLKKTTKEHIGQRKHYNGILKLFWMQWKWKHGISEFTGYNMVLTGKFMALSAYINEWLSYYLT